MTSLDPQTAPTLHQGSRNDWVAYLQGCLSTLGHPTGTPDGDFGPRTGAAVVAFQQSAGLGADGVVGPRTWAAILAAFNAPTQPGGGGTGDGQPAGHLLDPTRAPTLRRGHRGEWVHYLQELLERSGHSPGGVDGIFGSRTDAAVRSFQAANGCGVDGIVGPHTWTALVPVAAGHPTAPPYGTTPTRPGGGGGGGGGTPGGGDTTVTTNIGASFSGGTTIDFTFPTTNHGATAVIVKAIEWSLAGGAFNVTDTVESAEEAGPGATVTPGAAIPGTPASEPETVTVRAVAVWTDTAGREHRSPPVTKGLTLNPDGTITEGPAQKPDPAEPKAKVEPKVTAVVSTDAEIDRENQTLGWHVNVHNGTDALISAFGTVYSVQSGATTFNSSNQNGGPISPDETVRYSDVVPMGPSAAAPYPVTITAFVEFGDGTETRSSSTGSVSFTIDGAGVVNGTAHGSGGEIPAPGEPDPDAPPPEGFPRIVVECFASPTLFDGQTVHGVARASNHGGPAEGLSLTVMLEGAGSNQNTVSVARLPGGEAMEAAVSTTLPAERTDPVHLVVRAVATDSSGATDGNARAITVLPDGTVQQA